MFTIVKAKKPKIIITNYAQVLREEGNKFWNRMAKFNTLSF